jgi:hypothetical protein|tara:strand:- start:6937 stop:7182 length:246 start_codon:yes stop_codon:yes gene_type:complete
LSTELDVPLPGTLIRVLPCGTKSLPARTSVIRINRHTLSITGSKQGITIWHLAPLINDVTFFYLIARHIKLFLRLVGFTGF